MVLNGKSFDKADITVALVQRLVSGQFPQWAELPVRPVERSGWDNRTFHLGSKMIVRLPSAAHYSAQVQKEQTWLPRLAPLLPLPIPVPLAMGSPAEGYPWHWSIYQWREGETAETARIESLPGFAAQLAEFLAAMQRIDPTGGPPPGLHNFYRGGPLAVYDAETRQSIADLDGRIDSGLATEVWEEALRSTWRNPPVWVHGDVAVGNLLVRNGRLSAVIDFGSTSVGDPACDLVIAWTFLHGESREAFRAGLPLDEATWARGRGWALWKGLIVMAAQAQTNAAEAANAARAVAEVLADYQREA